METPAYNPAARHWFAGVMMLRRLNSVSDTTAPNSQVTKNIRSTPIDCALSLYGSRVNEFRSTSIASRGNWEGSAMGGVLIKSKPSVLKTIAPISAIAIVEPTQGGAARVGEERCSGRGAGGAALRFLPRGAAGVSGLPAVAGAGRAAGIGAASASSAGTQFSPATTNIAAYVQKYVRVATMAMPARLISR